jgi:hypothetical protein
MPQVWAGRRHRCVTRESTTPDHAAVTATVHDRLMLSATRHSEPSRAGVLILRVWMEGSGGDQQLRIRMVGRPDLERDAKDTASASTIEETLAYVRGWLERFASSAP